MTGRIVEARALIHLNRPQPATRDEFKRAVMMTLKVAHQKAVVLAEMTGQDIDLDPYLEDIAQHAETWQAKEIERRAGGS